MKTSVGPTKDTQSCPDRLTNEDQNDEVLVFCNAITHHSRDYYNVFPAFNAKTLVNLKWLPNSADKTKKSLA